ncbi:hypothetical protein SCHPADRAFT_694960 [Schizopora paradoxa]|uniref:Uncharacterized protein n=1 Tax=Schizopora paradoxa TaxID=27342 RepID=A0A0H2R377_9AGAM|nr:hypothetical protein SCHPADRAFT_694960 [Schizopora paradoxa]
MISETKGRLLPQIPVIVTRFNRMVVDDYLSAVAGFHTTSQNNWAARFKSDEDTELEGPKIYHVNYARQALSFVNTQRGIISYEMLEAVGWWTPLLPAPRSVLLLAATALQQLGFEPDVSMSHMMSFQANFLCLLCGNKERMSWISLLDHFQTQQILYKRANITNGMLDLDLPLYDCHSELDHSPVAKIFGMDEDDWRDTRNAGSIVDFVPPKSCNLCKRLHVETSFETKADIQAHFRSWHHGFIAFDS